MPWLAREEAFSGRWSLRQERSGETVRTEDHPKFVAMMANTGGNIYNPRDTEQQRNYEMRQLHHVQQTTGWQQSSWSAREGWQYDPREWPTRSSWHHSGPWSSWN